MKTLICYCLLLLTLTGCFDPVYTKPTIGKGYITDTDKKPVEGVRVNFFVQKNGAVSGGFKTLGSTSSNAQGYYEISYLIPTGYGSPNIEVSFGSLPYSYEAPYTQGKPSSATLIPEQTTQIDWILFK